MLNNIPPPLSGQRYSWPPMFTESAACHPWHALLISSSVGWLDELAGSTVSLEDSGVIVELVGAESELAGSATELLDSSADEMAFMSELLTGSWLSGISTTWLELLCVFSTWLEFAGSSVRVELLGVVSFWLELLSVSDERMESG